MSVGWGKFPDDDDEPTTPFIVFDMSVDPTVPGAVYVATYDPVTGSYVVPNGEQSDLHTG